MRSLKIFIGLLLPYFILSCGREIHSNMIEDLDYEQYDTYAWIMPTDEQLQNEIIHNNIHHFVNREMHERGFAADSVNPDILIDYRLVVREQEIRTVEPFFPTSPFPRRLWQPDNSLLSYQIQEGYYEEGVLVIDAYDQLKNQHIWSGWLVEPVNGNTFKRRNLRRGIRKIFKEFPVDD